MTVLATTESEARAEREKAAQLADRAARAEATAETLQRIVDRSAPSGQQ